MSIDSYVHHRQAVIFIVKLIFLSTGSARSVHALPVGPASGLSKLEYGPILGAARTWLLLGIAAVLVLAGGVFAGLTIALMGQDEVYLQVLKSSGDEREKNHAARVLDLLDKGKHWVLVTLLLSNVITNETLPIVLDRSIGGGWPAILSSTVLIVIFGEIIPQSICVCHGLTVGAWMAPFVMLLMRLMSPISYPTALLLDKLLGKGHKTMYKKAGLKTLVTLHKTLGAAGEQLNSDEVTIISAVLDLKEKPVGSIMTPMENVFTMSADSVLDEKAMDMILSQGYSRIPIHTPDNPENFIGMLLVKMLITYDPEDCKQVTDFALATLPETRPETSCLEIVNFFQEGKSHMVIVSESPGDDHGALGVVTLEDVIEELIGEEIIDESDVFVDVHRAIRRLTPAPKLMLPKGLFVPSVSSRVNTDGDNRLTATAVSGPLQTACMQARDGQSHGSRPSWLKTAKMSRSAEDLLNGRRYSEDDIREHLKRLGPSNPSSKPLQTRVMNVKIKPGAAAGKADHDASTVGSRPATADQYAANDASDGAFRRTTTPLLRHKSGDQATRATYGALDDLGTDRDMHRDELSPNLTGESNPPSEAAAPGDLAGSSGLSRHTSRHSSESWGSAASRSGGSRSPVRSRRATNSGSITEQVINVNGIQKVVLQTAHGDGSSGSPGTSPPHKPERRERARRVSDIEEYGGLASEDDALESSLEPLVNTDRDVPSSSSRKKRKRRKKARRFANATD